MIESRRPRPQSSGQLKLLLLLTLLLVGGLAFPSFIRYKFLMYSLIALLLTQVMVRDVDTHAWANFAYRLLGAIAVVAMWLWLLTPLDLIYSGMPLALSWGVLVAWSIRRLIMQIPRTGDQRSDVDGSCGWLPASRPDGSADRERSDNLMSGCSSGAVKDMVGGSVNVLSVGDVFAQITYFAFVCLTTLGFGDITPMLPMARTISVATSIVGPLYLAIVLGILIGRFVSSSRDQSSSRP